MVWCTNCQHGHKLTPEGYCPCCGVFINQPVLDAIMVEVEESIVKDNEYLINEETKIECDSEVQYIQKDKVTKKRGRPRGSKNKKN